MKQFLALATVITLAACSPQVDFTHVRTGDEPTEAQERAGEIALFGLIAAGSCTLAGVCFP